MAFSALTTIVVLISNHYYVTFASDIEYHIDPTHDVTRGLDKECVIRCEESNSCSGRIFTFLNDWGVTKTKDNATLSCTGDYSCNGVILIANTSSLILNFEGNDGWSMEAYINFGSSSDDLQSATINCNGEYSCESGSFVFNSMLDTDQGSQEMETISNGIVNLNCNEYGSCENLVVTAFQIFDLTVNCQAPRSCSSLTLYSPIKYHINYMDPNTNLLCDARAGNGSYDGACHDVKIFNYAGKHLARATCNDDECEIELHCGLMFEYECDYLKCPINHICATGMSLDDNQYVASPNKLVMDYTPNEWIGAEIYIYVSTTYEKFTYFYSQTDSWLFNASYPQIYCPRDGSCNIICTDIGWGAHYDHCAYGIYYGNYSESMTVRGYEADHSIWYGATNSFWFKGLYGNNDIILDLSQTAGNIKLDCTGETDTFSWSPYSGCQSFEIFTYLPEIIEINCHQYYSCQDTQIYTSLGLINEFPTNLHLNCSELTNITDHTTCRGMGVHFGDGSGCEYAITTKNGKDEYWDCIDWYTPTPTTPTPTTVNLTIFTTTTTTSAGTG
eukprot:255370_1